MNHDVIISCAVTGDDTKVTKSPHCAVTPEQIAERVGLSAISRDVEIQEMGKTTSIDNVAQTIQKNLVSE